MSESLLELEDVDVHYETEAGQLTAVSGASFAVDEGEYFGLVGESGCGKSTIAKSIIGGLDANGEITSGSIRYKGEEIHSLSEAEKNETVRWKEISYIPQASMSSLDPLVRVEKQAREIATVHDADVSKAMETFRDLFEIMGISENRISDYPHEFSGGMEQRAVIAMSLFLEPSLIIADEPTTALDVIMQDQIFRHLDDIKEAINTSMLLITHDISLVFEACDRMAVMHGGQVAETGSCRDIYRSPRHPYSILLQKAFPDPRYPKRELEGIRGEPPQTFGQITQCSFADRCPWAVGECDRKEPSLEPVDDDGHHEAACFRTDEIRELADSDEASTQTTNSAAEGKR